MEKNSLPIFIQLFCLVKQLNENDAVFFWVKGIHKTKTGLHSPALKTSTGNFLYFDDGRFNA